MSHPLQLNIPMGQTPGHKQRYSFIETPLEMHASSQYSETAHAPPLPTTTSPVPQLFTTSQQGVQQEQTSHYVSHEQPGPFSSAEKERQLQQVGIIPTCSKYPPIEQHPALYAPLADGPQQQQPQPVQSLQYPYSDSGPPPGSPGPLPAKADPEAPSRTDTVAIAPDVNPLQSPKSPYFPPPTTTTPSQAPAADEWSSYHQPGQVIHPNQEVQGGTWSHGLCEFSKIGTCCVGLFCPCILYGKTQYRLSLKSRKEDPTNMLGYETCNGSCSMMAFLCGCQCEFNRHKSIAVKYRY